VQKSLSAEAIQAIFESIITKGGASDDINPADDITANDHLQLASAKAANANEKDENKQQQQQEQEQEQKNNNSKREAEEKQTETVTNEQQQQEENNCNAQEMLCRALLGCSSSMDDNEDNASRACHIPSYFDHELNRQRRQAMRAAAIDLSLSEDHQAEGGGGGWPAKAADDCSASSSQSSTTTNEAAGTIDYSNFNCDTKEEDDAAATSTGGTQTIADLLLYCERLQASNIHLERKLHRVLFENLQNTSHYETSAATTTNIATQKKQQLQTKKQKKEEEEERLESIAEQVQMLTHSLQDVQVSS